jgi:hypothetical protein
MFGGAAGRGAAPPVSALAAAGQTLRRTCLADDLE